MPSNVEGENLMKCDDFTDKSDDAAVDISDAPADDRDVKPTHQPNPTQPNTKTRTMTKAILMIDM